MQRASRRCGSRGGGCRPPWLAAQHRRLATTLPAGLIERSLSVGLLGPPNVGKVRAAHSPCSFGRSS